MLTPTTARARRRAVYRLAVLSIAILAFSWEPSAHGATPVPVANFTVGGELHYPHEVTGPVVIDLLAFVSDEDGHRLHVTGASVDSGTLGPVDRGTVVFTPSSSTPAEARISFTVEDERTGQAGFTLVVNPGQVAGPTPPAAPTNLLATPDTSGGSLRVLLSWVDRSDDEVGFEIHRKSSAESAFTRLLTVGPNTEGAEDALVVSGETYTYFVRAFNEAGGADSGTATVQLSAPEGAPAAPTDLDAYVAEPIPTVLWTVVEWADRSSDEAGFRVLRRTLPETSYIERGVVGPNETSFAEESPAVVGQTYGYVVEAFNSHGTTRSAELVFVGELEPLVGPTGLSAVAGTTPGGSASVSLVWTDRDVREWGFRVYRRAGTTGGRVLLDSLSVDSESYVDGLAAPGTTYTYEVESYRGTGTSAEVSPAAVVTVSVPPLVTVVARDDPSIIDDPRFLTETGVPLFLCEEAYAVNDAPDSEVLYGLSSVPEPGFPDHGRHGWDNRPEECPEDPFGSGILYTPDADFLCGTDEFLYRLYFVGTDPVIQDTAVITVRVNQPPTPAFTAECDGLRCTFDASASTDPCSSLPEVVSPGIVSYEWRVEGEPVGSGPVFEHDLPAGGTYQVTLAVEDSEGAVRSSSSSITVEDELLELLLLILD